MITPLRQARIDRNESIAWVATQVAVTPPHLSRVECGKRQPNRDLARALYRYYGGTVDLGLIYDATFGAD